MEYKIGQIFEIDDVWYQFVKDNANGCNSCVFQMGGRCVNPEDGVKCGSWQRIDKMDGHFVRLLPIGDVYEQGGATWQQYKCIKKPNTEDKRVYIAHTDSDIGLIVSIKLTSSNDMENNEKHSNSENKGICDKAENGGLHRYGKNSMGGIIKTKEQITKPNFENKAVSSMEFSDELKKKVGQSIRLLQSVKTDGPIEVCYSGGKDSDVILELAKMAGINYRAIYKNTTIDPPGTIKHCKEKGVEILQPKKIFFQIVEEAGWPSRWHRFCCSYLKEYKVLDYSIQGIRSCESSKRRARYKEPIVCRLYNNKERAEIVYPILNWSNDNVVEFVNKMSIKCHPLYYDENGKFHVERRLGCIGCPLQHDWGVSQFREYPNMFKAWMKAFCKWWYKPRNKPSKSHERFRDPYEATVCRLFYGGANELDSIRGHNLFETPIDCKKFLEDYFKIKL